MTREKALALLEAWMNGEWDEVRDGTLRERLKGHEDLLAEMELWEAMSGLAVETPSAALDGRLHDMLDAFKAEAGRRAGRQAAGGWLGWLEEVWPRQPVAAMALAGLCLAAGLAGGWMANGFVRGSDAATMQTLRRELSDTREMAVLAMLNRPGAADRLLGVSDAANLRGENPLVRNALFRTLWLDSSVNVRLAALDALRGQASEPEVRTALQQAVRAEESPLVQIELVRVLARVDHPEAQQCLAELVANPAVDATVRDAAARVLQLEL